MASIKDVARLAGVSTATVSRALASPDKVAAATRDKVMEAVDATGYVGNALASNLRRQRTNTVVVLVPDIANPFYAHIIQGIERIAHAHHYRILLGDIGGDRDREAGYARLVTQRQADGVISLGHELPAGQDGSGDDFPLAMACEYYGDGDVPVVRIDNYRAAVEAVTALLELGHRRIGYIDGPAGFPICAERRRGYHDALAAAGLQLDDALLARGDFGLRSGVSAMSRLLAAEPPPTAVFAANDEMAIGAVRAIKSAALSVPADISVMGFDDIGFAEYCDPPLSTVHQPRDRIGETLMQLMLSILSGATPEPAEVILPHELLIRASTAAPGA